MLHNKTPSPLCLLVKGMSHRFLGPTRRERRLPCHRESPSRLPMLVRSACSIPPTWRHTSVEPRRNSERLGGPRDWHRRTVQQMQYPYPLLTVLLRRDPRRESSARRRRPKLWNGKPPAPRHHWGARVERRSHQSGPWLSCHGHRDRTDGAVADRAGVSRIVERQRDGASLPVGSDIRRADGEQASEGGSAASQSGQQHACARG